MRRAWQSSYLLQWRVERRREAGVKFALWTAAMLVLGWAFWSRVLEGVLQ